MKGLASPPACHRGDIFDLQIVATMKLNGISRIYTFNTDDFKPFAEIESLTP
jgi:predicted nucleic acid-binding protein